MYTMTMAEHNNILPDDILLTQILPQVPAKSLGRFMCVCKQWRSFLTTPKFTKMHLQHVNNQNHHKLLVVHITKARRYFQTIDCETPETGLSPTRPLPFEDNSNRMSTISSLNGLICVGIKSSWVDEYKYSDIILWNPLTGDHKTLYNDNYSRANSFRVAARGYGLFYSSCDDYKLLRITKASGAYIYSLKSDSWRKVESTINCRLQIWNLSCSLNENLYFLAQGITQASAWSYLIIWFDMQTEKFTEIPAPSFEYTTGCLSLTVVSECVHLCVSSKGINPCDKLEVWKMDGDGEWTKVRCYCGELCRSVSSRSLHLMKNGNWLVRSTDKGYVHEVDLEMKTEKKTHVYTTAATDGIMDFLQRGKFVETIVSLKQ